MHGACDFISSVDTPAIWELNIWYHTLNCGYTCRISGETDFPCIYGDKVGLGRAYVKLGQDQPLDFDRWVDGLGDGRSYCCDGLCHLFNFTVNGQGVGEKGAGGKPSLLATGGGKPLEIKVRAAALLADKPRDDIRQTPLDQKPYWHIERARIGDSDKVPVELIVNGRSVEKQDLVADGTIRDLTFKYTPDRSSWVALRSLSELPHQPRVRRSGWQADPRQPRRAPNGVSTRSTSAGSKRSNKLAPAKKPPPPKPMTSPGVPMVKYWQSRCRIDSRSGTVPILQPRGSAGTVP